MGNKVPKTEGIQIPSSFDDGSGEIHSKCRRVVTVIRRDGTKLMFERGMGVSKLLKDFPGHAVYRASEELEYLGRARALSPNTSLKRGNTYVLLPQTQKQQMQKKPRQQGLGISMKGRWSSSKVNPVMSAFDSDSDEEEAEEASPPLQAIKVRMTKQQFAQMVRDGSIRLAGSQTAQEVGKLTVAFRPPTVWNCSMKLFNQPQLASAESNLLTACSLTKRSWSPELPSILEVPAQ